MHRAGHPFSASGHPEAGRVSTPARERGGRARGPRRRRRGACAAPSIFVCPKSPPPAPKVLKVEGVFRQSLASVLRLRTSLHTGPTVGLPTERRATCNPIRRRKLSHAPDKLPPASLQLTHAPHESRQCARQSPYARVNPRGAGENREPHAYSRGRCGVQRAGAGETGAVRGKASRCGRRVEPVRA